MTVAEVPELSVIVPTHNRPLRLRWLLNALAEQTLDLGLWEVIVGDDSEGDESMKLMADHPLTLAGVLRFVRVMPKLQAPGANRNAALRLARAPTIVFTDDDCRPPPAWLQRVREAVSRHPGAIIQGMVRSDPAEMAMLDSPFPHTQAFGRVPRPWAECCNIVYPRELIERVGGFREDLLTGEDADLNARARATGVSYVGDEGMLNYHALEEGSLRTRLRAAWRWRHMPLLIRLHPELRESFPMWIFWRRSHGWLPLMLAGLALERRTPLWLLLTVPWLGQWEVRGEAPADRLEYLLRLPSYAAADLAEMLVLLAASIRYRSLLI
jgi:glycosyltransferase involved in cell wall biosynthesis